MKTELSNTSDDFSVEAACVQVLSMVTASVSHEIKNVLAIINENGGLLEDLVLMGGPEQGVPPGHVKAATATIARQVDRANLIMKNCNRLAHLGDRPVSQEPLSEIVELMTALAGRQADMKNITLRADCLQKVTITAPMLQFGSLIYLLLRGLIDASGSDAAITVSAEAARNTLSLEFSAGLPVDELEAKLQNRELHGLLHRLKGSARIDRGSITINVPAEIS